MTSGTSVRYSPEADGAVLSGGDDDREPLVEQHGRDVVAVPLQGLHAGLGLVVPDLHRAIVGACHKSNSKEAYNRCNGPGRVHGVTDWFSYMRTYDL